MHGLLAQHPPSPPSLSRLSQGPEQLLAPLPPPLRDVPVHPYPQPGHLPVTLRGIIDLTDTPTNPRSVSSTAPSSPRMLVFYISTHHVLSIA